MRFEVQFENEDGEFVATTIVEAEDREAALEEANDVLRTSRDIFGPNVMLGKVINWSGWGL